MDEAGHEALVRLVNKQIGGRFPEEELLRGSTDPDKGEIRSYRGDESKHHFDASVHTGRRKDANDICRVVWRHTENARRFWLSGDTRSSAFYFGVATHFLMDGHIVSPSVSENKHAAGDRAFAAKVKKLRANPSVDYPEGDRTQAEQALLGVRNALGTNDSTAVVGAVDALIRIGLAVTAPAEPPRFISAGQVVCAEFSSSAACLYNDYQKAATASVDHQARVLVKLAYGKFHNSPFCQHGLAIDGMYREMGKSNLSIASQVGRWLYRTTLRSCLSLTGLPKHLLQEKCKVEHAFEALRYRFCQQVQRVEASWSSQSGWFNLADGPRRWRAELEEQEKSWRKEQWRILSTARKDCQKVMHAVEARHRAQALEQLPKWWTGTLRDRVSDDLGDTPGETWGLAFGAMLIPFLILGICSFIWFGLACAVIAGSVWVFASIVAGRFLSHCKVVSRFVRQRFKEPNEGIDQNF